MQYVRYMCTVPLLDIIKTLEFHIIILTTLYLSISHISENALDDTYVYIAKITTNKYINSLQPRNGDIDLGQYWFR